MKAKYSQPVADWVPVRQTNFASQLHKPSQSFTSDIFASMKVSLLCSATLFSLATLAFPANLLKGDISEATLAEITALTEKITRDLETKRQGGHVKRAFNAEAQRISTTGDHKYVSRSLETKIQQYTC
jgi:hypothetical protein